MASVPLISSKVCSSTPENPPERKSPQISTHYARNISGWLIKAKKPKDNDFNATMETHFDPNLPKIDIIPQDIGRVLLNLINNAFYAVNERSKNEEWIPTYSLGKL